MVEEKKYFPQLDAIRGISVLAVFFFHGYKPNLGTSLFEKFLSFTLSHLAMGLDVFFILSSFLLTLLGITEYEKTGGFSLKNYFIRRVLRIWPLYYTIMFFSFVILKIVESYTKHQISLPPPAWYLFFISNFYLPDHVFFLRLLWTLSVEEQFYLLWGICLLFFQKKLKIVIGVLALISLSFILFQTLNRVGIYFNTLTYIIDMMAGAFAAYCIRRNNSIVKRFRYTSKRDEIFLYLSFPILFVIFFCINGWFVETINNLLEELLRIVFIIYCSIIIIIQMVKKAPLLTLSKNYLLIYTGKISYGLYCFHGIVISCGYLTLKKFGIIIPPSVSAIIFLIFTFIISILSYKYIESPFLKLKNKVRSV